jgi:hypothetical protein
VAECSDRYFVVALSLAGTLLPARADDYRIAAIDDAISVHVRPMVRGIRCVA